VTQTATAKPAAQAGARNPSAMPAAAKGQQEGITVHGHWVIEVKNPDGSLVRHVEVENSLDPGFPLSYTSSTNATPSGTQNVPGGAAFLNALLNGQAVSNAGSWGILLVGPEGLTNLSTTSIPGNVPQPPCVTRGFNFPPSTFAVPLRTCILLQPYISGTNNYVSQTNCPGSSTYPAGIPGVGCTLTSSILGTYPNFSGFQLSGSLTAGLTGNISAVATVNFDPCTLPGLPPLPISGCPFEPGVGGNLVNLVSLTSTTLNPAVPVISGQTIQATVTISFGSGS